MTYQPVPTTTIKTSFGEVLLVVNSKIVAQILTGPEDGFLTINGVTYHGRLEFERVDGIGWRLRTENNGYTDYIAGITMSRVDDYSKKLSDAARKKLVSVLVPEVDAFMQTGKGLELMREADIRKRVNEFNSAKAKVEDLREKLEVAEREMSRLQACFGDGE